MKKLASLILTLSLIACMAPAASAASAEATAAAETLYALGLFRGTGTNADGTPIFDLDKTPTRNQAVIMLVRLLGKEDEALAGKWELPFSDVSPNSAAYPYIGYAYANKLTAGYTATTFSGAVPIRTNQYITFVLRALGYESGKDFEVGTAWDLSDRLGITAGQYSAANANRFIRGDLAQISCGALSAEVQGTGQTLLEKLRSEGAIRETDSSLCKQDIAPANLVFQTIPADCYHLWGTVALKDFTLQSIQYASCGSDVYFRVHYKSSSLQKFFVLPVNMMFDDLGPMVRYAAPSSGGVFTCKVAKSSFNRYSQLAISPSEDGSSGPDYVIDVGYLPLTESDAPAAFVPAAKVADDSGDVADFRFLSAEYAEVLGGRLYRIRFDNDAHRIVQFWTLREGQSSGFDKRLARIVTPQAGDTEAFYFVSDTAMAENTYILVRVRDSFSIDPLGGSQQEHSEIHICF